ncbi:MULTISPECIES: phycobilisome linker polypeptide [unclassified Microcoleus]|nr:MULTISPECIES: phycobilisome linker polypeptide [unclassified Microcoleus]
MRCRTTEYLVSYDRLSTRLQQINKRGGKVVSITTA